MDWGQNNRGYMSKYRYIGPGTRISPTKDGDNWNICGFFSVYDCPLSSFLNKYNDVKEIECKGKIISDDEFYNEGEYELHPNAAIVTGIDRRVLELYGRTKQSYLVVPNNWKDILATEKENILDSLGPK
jgi:hypothetical protein